jgi:hypothetical protein
MRGSGAAAIAIGLDGKTRRMADNIEAPAEGNRRGQCCRCPSEGTDAGDMRQQQQQTAASAMFVAGFRVRSGTASAFLCRRRRHGAVGGVSKFCSGNSAPERTISKVQLLA